MRDVGNATAAPFRRARAVAHRYAAPLDSSPARRRNFEVVQLDSIAMGIMGAASTFLPVFLVRLGGGPLEVGILTILPALGGLLFAVPMGRLMERRGDVVDWYAVSRVVVTFAYTGSALLTAFVAPGAVVPLVLLLWALVVLPQTIGQVTFPIVMDGAAGPMGRVDLMARRWAIMGLGTAVAVAVAGVVLDVLGMPLGYEVVLISGTLAGLASYHWSRQIVVDADRPPPPPSANTAGLPALELIRSQPEFLGFVRRKAVFVAGVRLVAPLLPIYYVHTLGASDAWIGIIAMIQSLSLVAGYMVWRRQARRMHPRTMLLWTLSVYGAIPAAFALTSSVEVVMILSAIGSFFGAGSDLALFDELMARMPRAQAVTFAGVDYAVTNLAGVLAPLAAAVLVAGFGIQWSLVAGAALSVLGLALFTRARIGTHVAADPPFDRATPEGPAAAG